jgi:hypothetical protein
MFDQHMRLVVAHFKKTSDAGAATSFVPFAEL